MMDHLLDKLSEKINNDPQGIIGFNAVFACDLSGENGGIYQIKFQDNKVEYCQDLLDTAHCTLKLSDKNFVK